MDSGRIFRALVMFLTLLGVLWIIRGVTSKRHVTRPVAEPAAVIADVAAPDSALPTLVSIPFAAFGNTCGTGQIVDLSGCTGKVSRSEGRSYQFRADEGQSLVLTVTPMDEFFDPSFALLTEDGRCVAGRDKLGDGQAESLPVSSLPAGNYELVVSGYSDHCGPYQLSIHEPLPLFVRVSEPRFVSGTNGLAIRWESFGESPGVQYQLFRDSDKGRELVTTLRGRGGPARTVTYRCVDRAPEPNSQYEIVAVGGDGNSQLAASASY